MQIMTQVLLHNLTHTTWNSSWSMHQRLGPTLVVFDGIDLPRH